MQFIYRSASGHVAAWALEDPQAVGDYLQGFAGDHFRTFRRDRILRELLPSDDAAALVAAYAAQAPLAFEARQARPRRGEAIEVLFTGFPAADRRALEAVAEANGLRVVKTLTKQLGVLCVNGHIGPGRLARNHKVDKARTAGALVLSDEQLLQMIETGEIPD